MFVLYIKYTRARRMLGYVLPVVNRFNNIHICFISNVSAILPLRFSMARFMNATLIYSTLIISVVIGKITVIFILINE